jgi:uncharacterized protein (TIGR02118 family)
MFKAMILLKRNEDISKEDFTSWMLNDHAPLARQLPGLRKAVFNIVDPETEDGIDTISELWFDSQKDFEAAYATEKGKAVAADSLARVSSRIRLFIDEHSIFPS